MSTALLWVVLGVLVAVLGVMVAGFFAVVTMMRSEVGRLDIKIDNLTTDLRSDIGRLDTKIDKSTMGLRSEIGSLRSEMVTQFSRLEARTDAQTTRIDHLAERVEEHLRSHSGQPAPN